MPTKVPLTMSSGASGLVAYPPNWVDQSTVPHVDVPTQFVIVKDSLITFPNVVNRAALGKNSLAICSDAMKLLSAWLDERPSPLLHDADYFWHIDVRKPSFFAEPKRTRLFSSLCAAFEAEPLEDGIDHPAEQIIKKAFQFPEDQLIFNWFENFSLDIERPSLAASILRCLGRQTNLGTSSWRAGLIGKSLSVDNVEIRDAAVQATESWDDPDLADILRSHHETELWLREYILGVIDDLGR